MHDHQAFLQTLAIVLVGAAITTVVFQWLKQPVVLGYLLAGMVTGPHVPIPITADVHVVQTLAELGVILLMFSLGIEFSLDKLLRVGPTAGVVAIIQCSLMMWLGYLVGQALGWSWLASLYAGAVVAISSTTIIIKAFQERRTDDDDFKQIVFGILIVEDVIAILLITILTALSEGQKVELGLTVGRLALFLIGILMIGLLTVPRIMRGVVRLDRAETTVVTGVSIAFSLAYLASYFGYSVALGAFIAGSLVAESGVEQTIEHLMQPIRDLFAAIFFVSVGMQIDPQAITEHWVAVLAFLLVVVLGNISAVGLGAFLTGKSVQTSIKAGMSLAQIGEFSFIIAGVGIATGATDNILYSIAVAVSGLTTLLTPWLIRAADPTAAFIDRKLPRPLQTFVSLYGSWLEQIKTAAADGHVAQVRRLVRWLIVDALLVAAIIIGASVEMERITLLAQEHLGISPRLAQILIIAGAFAISAPFWFGLIRVTRYLGFELANRVFPGAEKGKVDFAAAPRRLLIVTLQLAIVVSIGVPLVMITQPFLPPLQGAIVLLLLLTLLAFSLWRSAANLQGHTRAAAQAIVELIAHRTQEGKAAGAAGAATTHQTEDMNRILMGLGSPVPVPISPDSPVVGKKLAEINLRGLTGATVLAIQRGNDSIVVPSGAERVMAGDVLAVAGSQDAITDAIELLAAIDRA